MNARSALAGPDLEARFFLAGADDVEAGPDEAGLLDDTPPPLPLLLLLLPLPCRCSVAEVEGGAMFRPMSARGRACRVPWSEIRCRVAAELCQVSFISAATTSEHKFHHPD